MPWNFLLFHLAAGYYICTRSYFYKFKYQRLDRQRLVFESILLGVFVAAFTFTLRAILIKLFPQIYVEIRGNLPFKIPFLWTSLLTLIISILLTEITNILVNKNNTIKSSIKNVGNELELIFLSSFEKRKLILISLKSDKFYIGWVKELPIPSISNYIRIIPAISGFRDESKELVFTTHYLNVYADFITDGKVNRVEDLNFDIVLNMSEIITVGNFDLDLYQRFNIDKNGNNL